MFNRKRIIVAFGALALASGSAFADAFADGVSDVTAMLINIGTNSNGGTGSQISESIFSMDNGAFNFLIAGPGSSSFFQGGGLINSGFDAGAGLGWSFGGSNSQTGFDTTESGFSDASNTVGTSNTATEDTYNLVVYKLTNTSATKGEWFNLDMMDGVTAEVDLDNSTMEYGLDKAILNFGYSDSTGAFTGNTTTNTAYAYTGMGYGSDVFAFVQNEIDVQYKGFLSPGKSIYFAVESENFSQVAARAVPGPAAAAPFFVGLLAAARRRKKA